MFAGLYLEAEVGLGGAGAVFRARRPDGERVAIKVLLRDLDDERQRIRFEREAEAGLKLRHPGVIAVYGAGVEQGLGYMVMELLVGALPLDEYVAAHDLDLMSRVRMMSEIALAVHAAHEVGLIHRDLKPDNVLVTAEGRPRVVDFGLARHMDQERLTQSGVTMGTLFYMSPEQIRGETAHADARTDVFALGVMLYQLLTGRLPFTGDSAVEIMRAVLEFEPAPLPLEVSDLEPVVRVALAKLPAQRYATAADFARDLVATGSSQGTAASGVLAARRRQRATRITLVTLPVVVALIAMLAYLFSPSSADPRADLAASLDALRADPAPLASSAAAIEALRPLPDAPKLSAEVVRLQALLQMARGEQPPGDPPGEGQTPLAWALSGARQGEEGVGLLTRAMRGGCARADLHRWRALALAKRPRLGHPDARKLLADVNAWRGAARQSDPHTDPGLAKAEARALVAQGELEAAEAILIQLPSPPPGILWEIGLARAKAALATRPSAAWAAIEGLPAGPVPAGSATLARELGRHALRALGSLARRGVTVKSEASSLALLRLWERLGQESPFPQGLSKTLLESSNGIRGPLLLELAICLSEIFVDDLAIQREMVPIAGRLRKGAQRRLFPAIRRAARLETKPDLRFKHEMTLAYLLVHTSSLTPEEIAEFEELTARLLPVIQDDELRAVLLLARGRQLLVRGELERGESDLREAVRLDPALGVARFTLAKLYQRRKRPAEALKEGLVYLNGTERNSGRRQNLICYAWRHQTEPLAAETIRSYLSADPGHGGWWLRLALLEFRPQRVAALLEWCGKARKLFAASEDSAWAQTAGEIVEIERLLQSQSWEEAKRKLAASVARLDVLRGRKTFP